MTTQLQVKCHELDALTVASERSGEMLKMLEDRLNTKDNELREREAEFKKMYNMHNRVTT